MSNRPLPEEKLQPRMADTRQPLVFIVSGPSGSGKSTLVHKLLELPGMMFSISCTTRQRRASEQDGKWYNFVTEEEFARMAEGGEFLEHAFVFGRYSYGTPRRWLDEAQAKNLDLVLEIDVQGAAQVKRTLPSAVAIFIMPPSREALEERLRSRGQDAPEEVSRRLAQARQEILSLSGYYEYLVINDDLERAGREVQAIALAERCRASRNGAPVQEILKSFGG
jgi:guanylate kinase